MKRIEQAGLTSNQAGYLWMDDSLGLILNKLDELKLAHNTIVLFVADHGSGHKGSLYKAKRHGGALHHALAGRDEGGRAQ